MFENFALIPSLNELAICLLTLHLSVTTSSLSVSVHEQVLREREELTTRMVHAELSQQEVDLRRNFRLETAIRELEDKLIAREEQINHIVQQYGIHPDILATVGRRLEEVIEDRNRVAEQLKYELAKITKVYVFLLFLVAMMLIASLLFTSCWIFRFIMMIMVFFFLSKTYVSKRWKFVKREEIQENPAFIFQPIPPPPFPRSVPSIVTLTCLVFFPLQKAHHDMIRVYREALRRQGVDESELPSDDAVFDEHRIDRACSITSNPAGLVVG